MRHPPGTFVVVLAAADEEHLRDISLVLGNNRLEFTLITETDGPYSGQAMAMGLELVADRGPVRKVVSSLPLLK